MKTENKRIFISDLPETFTKEELESSFSRHGQVSSVEIKERKELGPKNTTLFFAYVNLNTDDKSLNQCFRELSNTKWHGQYVQLQIARENFLERLKRERQENEGKQTNNLVENNIKEHVPSKQTPSKNDCIIKNQVQLKKYKSSSESDTSDSESDEDIKNIQNTQKRAGSQQFPNAQESKHAKLELDADVPTEKLDIIIKCNKNKLVDKGGLKIPSVGNTPIVEITKSKIKQNDSAANLKRLQSLRDMKKGYASQKSQIKNALAYGITKPNNKIVFDDESNNIGTENNKNKINGSKKNALFDDGNSGDDSDFEGNFDIKEQFQGEGGQKLLELQSKYKNDTRFALDKRFMEAEEGDGDVVNDEDNLEKERSDQLKILEEVLGKRITSNKSTSKNMTRKTMLKFDPSQPEHSNLAIPVSEPERKKKKKENLKGQDMSVSEKPQPEVSKEVYYKVAEKLTETLAEKSEFSLLSMFGRQEDNEDEKQEDETEKLINKQNPIMGNQNPFKYDSSDDEDETADIPHKDTRNSAPQIKNVDHKQTRTAQAVFWTEPFFFKNDDFRLQEGLDFIEKIKSQDKEFLKIRRELKGIVKAKVRNNERKNKMFKKKLGGSKRKKHIRMKKALKR